MYEKLFFNHHKARILFLRGNVGSIITKYLFDKSKAPVSYNSVQQTLSRNIDDVDKDLFPVDDANTIQQAVKSDNIGSGVIDMHGLSLSGSKYDRTKRMDILFDNNMIRTYIYQNKIYYYASQIDEPIDLEDSANLIGTIDGRNIKLLDGAKAKIGENFYNDLNGAVIENDRSDDAHLKINSIVSVRAPDGTADSNNCDDGDPNTLNDLCSESAQNIQNNNVAIGIVKVIGLAYFEDVNDYFIFKWTGKDEYNGKVEVKVYDNIQSGEDYSMYILGSLDNWKEYKDGKWDDYTSHKDKYNSYEIRQVNDILTSKSIFEMIDKIAKVADDKDNDAEIFYTDNNQFYNKIPDKSYSDSAGIIRRKLGVVFDTPKIIGSANSNILFALSEDISQISGADVRIYDLNDVDTGFSIRFDQTNNEYIIYASPALTMIGRAGSDGKIIIYSSNVNEVLKKVQPSEQNAFNSNVAKLNNAIIKGDKILA